MIACGYTACSRFYSAFGYCDSVAADAFCWQTNLSGTANRSIEGIDLCIEFLREWLSPPLVKQVRVFWMAFVLDDNRCQETDIGYSHRTYSLYVMLCRKLLI